jgi:ribosomal protein L30/L7E
MAVTRTRGPLNRDQSNAEIMRALLLCRNTDIAMRRHIRAETGMGDTDILAVDYLRDQHSQHQPVGPKQLASHLGLSSPSTTVLLDRLEKLGSVERMPTRPHDRGPRHRPLGHSEPRGCRGAHPTTHRATLGR